MLVLVHAVPARVDFEHHFCVVRPTDFEIYEFPA